MSTFIASTCLAVAGIIAYFVSIWMLIGYALGTGLATILTISVIRRLGAKAQESTLASTLFYAITRYKVTIYNIQIPQNKTTRTTIYGDGQECADILDILKNQLRFPTPIANEAAKYAMDSGSEQPFQEKIRIALQYLGGNTNATAKP